MKRKIYCTLISMVSIFIFLSSVESRYNSDIIEKVRPSHKEIPEGFIYGKIPGFAKKVLKNNPWMLDRKAIRKLANKIYPGGDSNRIKNIHMTIMAKNRSPFGDDIVCYIIVYRDTSSAQKEIQKLNEYTGYNSDRAIVVAKNNMAVFLHVDDIGHYSHIKEMAGKLENKLKGI